MLHSTEIQVKPRTSARHAFRFPRLLPAPRDGGFSLPGYWVWCPSVVKGDNGRYYMFASRWSKTVPFHPGWLTHSEIVLAVAETPVGPFAFEKVIFPARGPEYWDGCTTHNPRVLRWQGRYYMYYMGSQHPLEPQAGPASLSDPDVIVARSNKRIGLAVATNPEGPWTRLDAPILATKPNTFYSFLTSNPAPLIQPDGSVLLIFKARAYEGIKHGAMSIGLARAPKPEGPYSIVGTEPLFSPKRFGEIEDPFIWSSARGIELIAKDMTGALCDEKHAGLHAWSPDGNQWHISEAPLAYSRNILWDDGNRQTLGAMERPSLLFEDGKPTHLYVATGDGPGGFAHAKHTWNACIPLERFR